MLHSNRMQVSTKRGEITREHLENDSHSVDLPWTALSRSIHHMAILVINVRLTNDRYR